MGFYAPAQIVHDAQAHGVAVLPVDVNSSAWDCTLEGGLPSPLAPRPSPLRALTQPGSPALRLGFRLVKGLRQSAVQALVEARADGRFGSIADFSRRTRLRRALLARLAAADSKSELLDLSIEQLFESALVQEGLHPNPAEMLPRIQRLMALAAARE